jgi:ribonuclease PH
MTKTEMTTNSTVRLLNAEAKAKQLEAAGRIWAYAEYRSLPFNTHPRCHVRLHWGAIHSNGEREMEIAYEDFYEDGTTRIHARL